MKEPQLLNRQKEGTKYRILTWDLWKRSFQTHIWVKFGTHFMDLQDLRILRGPKMENRSPPGPQLCYLFQAGTPKIGIFGPSRPKNWPNRPGFDLLQRSKFAPPEGKSVLGPQILASLRSKSGSWVSDLGSQTLELASQRADLASRGQKWPLGDPKSVSQTWKIDPIFLILRWEKLPSFILDH